MLVKLPAGFLYGAKPTARIPPQVEMSVVVRGTFRLRPGEPVALVDDVVETGPLRGDTFADGDEERTGALLHASDFADFKLKTDVLLHGTCWPGKGRSARDCTVRVRIGGWSKSVRVFGRRVWTRVPGDPISNPAPFVSMPLTWENAFGGRELAANPVGRGVGEGELPNVEDPRALLRSRRDRPAPAGFGPINPAWPPRAGKLGKEYGAGWRKTRAPWYAVDFDWSHFNAAPLDQQISPYLRGDEELELEGLYDAAQSFASRLPALRTRAFVRHTSGLTREVPMNLDTLVADTDAALLHLFWRGLTPVDDEDFARVRTLFVATEPLEHRPLSVTHYAAAIDAFEAKPIDFDAYVPKEVLAKKSEAEAALRAMPKPPPDPDAAAHPLDLAAQAAAPALAGMDESQRAAAQQGFARMKAGFDAAKAKHAEMLAKAGGPQAVADPFTVSLGQLARAKEKATAKGMSTEPLDQATAKLEQARTEHAAAEARMEAAAKNAPPGATAVRIPSLAETTASAAAAASSGGAERAKAAAPQAAPGPRADLMGRDFSGHDLHAMNLEGALLRRARLRGTNLSGANLRRADLAEADLTDADLTGADLTCANLSKARAAGATLDRAKLAQTLFVGADLTGAKLNEIDGEMVVFSEATLDRARIVGSRLFKCVAHGARLEEADFTRTSLEGSLVTQAPAKKAIFAGCTLDRVAFLECDLSGASFVESQGEQASFQKSVLHDAFFHYARLPGAHFTEASLRGAHVYGAYLVRARFYRANLEQAEVVRCDLRSADMRKAVVGATKFTGTNLYDAKLFGVVGTAECDFFDANLNAAMWELP